MFTYTSRRLACRLIIPKSLLSVVVLAIVCCGKLAFADVAGYIGAALPWAQAAHQQYGVPISVAIAQTAQETSWSLPKSYNNFFNITYVGAGCDPYTTGSTPSGWRAYNSAGDAFLGYGYFITHDSYYTGGSGAGIDCRPDLNNPIQFLHDIAFDGFDGGPNASSTLKQNYYDTIKSIIDYNNLQQYDQSSSSSTINVPLFGQRVDPWQYNLLGYSSSDTIHDYGCALTSVAMILKYYGTNTDPGDLNNWLKAHNGYVQDDLLVWSVPATYGNNISYAGANDWTNVAADLGVVNAELDAGYPVVAETRLSGIQHFVVLTGHSGSTYYINDPWFNDQTTLTPRYGNDPAVAIYGIRKYHGQHSDPVTTPPNVSFNETNINKWAGPNDVNTAIVSFSLQDTGGGIGGLSQAWDHDDDNNLGTGPQFPTSHGGYMQMSYLDPSVRQGKHTVYIRAWNADRSQHQDYSSGWYGYDGLAPTVSITSGQTNGATYNTPQHVTWHIDDPDSGIASWGQAWDSDPGQQYNTSDGNLDLPVGTHTLHVHTWDNVGNNQDWTFGPYTYAPVAYKVTSLSLSTPSVTGGVPLTGTVTLGAAAPSGGLSVSLSSSNTAATVPATVTVPEGATSVTFDISTSAVSASQAIVITASGAGATAQANLSVNPQTVTITSVAFNPATVVGGKQTQVTVTLSGPAPQGGAMVIFGTPAHSIGGWDGVLSGLSLFAAIPQGMSTYTVSVSTLVVTATKSFTLTASLMPTSSGQPQSGTLTIQPVPAPTPRWTVTGISAGGSSVANLVCNTSDGSAFIEFLAPDGTSSVSVTFGPYAGAKAKALATAPDGTLRLLWTNVTGAAAVWTLSPQGKVTSYGKTFGPYTGASATGLAVAPNGTTRLLWTRNDGAANIWVLNAAGNPLSYGYTYGPYTGAAVTAFAIAPNSTTRLLWTRTTGEANIWTLDATGKPLSYGLVYGPYTGARASGLTVGADNLTRLLWTRNDGAANIWSVDATGHPTSYGYTYGPYTGAGVTGLAGAPDGTIRLLWTRTTGESNVWTLNSSGVPISYGRVYGPF